MTGEIEVFVEIGGQMHMPLIQPFH